MAVPMDIHRASESGNLKVVSQLLEAEPSHVHSRDGMDNQPLHLAAWQGRRHVAELLLCTGADADARGDGGRTPLHYAVENQRMSLARLLLQHGADANVEDDRFVTPLYAAASVQNQKMTALLLQNGAMKDLRSALYIDGPNTVLSRLQDDATTMTQIVHPGDFLWDVIRLHSL